MAGDDVGAQLPEQPGSPMLRPGLRVVRRDHAQLQVGLGPDRVVLPDHPGVRGILRALAAGHGDLPDTADAHGVCDVLHRAGLLVDSAALRRSGIDPAATAAAYAHDPLGAEQALARRGQAAVALDLPDPWRPPVAALVAGSGLGVVDHGAPAGVRLVGRETEPDRTEIDRLVRVGEPHLLLSCVDGLLTLGPFVDPGRTACLRCVDAHLAEADPRRPLVVEQYSRADTARGLPEPCDPALLALALAWAVRELVSWAEGRWPSLWSTSVLVTPALDLPRRRWTRHPHCGCSWGDALAVG